MTRASWSTGRTPATTAGTARKSPLRRSEKHNHHGGDGVLAHAFWRTAANQAAPSRAGLREGIDAALVALAAQQSAAAGQSIDITEMRNQVFG